MRASFWVLGPLLGAAERRVCRCRARLRHRHPAVDLHLMGMKALGAEIDIDGGYVVAKAPHGLRGARVEFPKVSVGATHNVLMAAALAKGETVIENAALEPEIGDVAECLIKMGAQIEGIGTRTLRIQGRSHLEGAVHTVLPDRIETGTYAFAVAAAGGDVELKGARKSLLDSAFTALEKTGVSIDETPTACGSPATGDLEPISSRPSRSQASQLTCSADEALMTRGTTPPFARPSSKTAYAVQELVRLGAEQLQGRTQPCAA